MKVKLLLILSILVNGLAMAQLTHFVSRYETGAFEAAEIVAYDHNNKMMYFVNADTKAIDKVDISNPMAPAYVLSLDISDYGKGPNSIAINDTLIAIAIEKDSAQLPGVVAFFSTNDAFLDTVTVGALPDMVAFTHDGSALLVANEAEPSDDYTYDPEGSISIIYLDNGLAGAEAVTADFHMWNMHKHSLINKGVRIFGPNASTSQDLEPEYIAVSENDELAYVSLQENNAIAVVDIQQAEVIDILPLGFKDHSKGAPDVDVYLINELVDIPALGKPLYQEDTVMLGGFSGLWCNLDESTEEEYVFYAIPDRGPNEGTVSKADAGTSQNLRPFKLPNYQARIVKFTLNRLSGAIELSDEDYIFLTQPDGTTPISGRGNIPGADEVPVTETDGTVYTDTTYLVDGRPFTQLDYDKFGGDFEGILIDKMGNFWMCDEYRPAIYKFNPNGVMIDRFVPAGTSQLGDTPMDSNFYGKESLPAQYAKRRANRGFEAIAYDSANNIIYAFIQSPMYNPNSGTKNNSDIIRILGIDAMTGLPVSEYVYLLERNALPGFAAKRVDKMGDAAYAGNGKFLVIERDSGIPGDKGSKKLVFEIDINYATNILDSSFAQLTDTTGTDLKTLEMMTADDLAMINVHPVLKRKVMNLPSYGYFVSDKTEGITFTPNNEVAVINDNDFGLAGEGVTDDIGLGIIAFGDNYGFDASNKSDDIYIENHPTLGMFQPDAITVLTMDDMDYILTANEGDARDYDGYSEEVRVKDLDLDSTIYPNFAMLQEDPELGRLKTTTANGDYDMDGYTEQIYSYGARSFSILDQYGNMIFDSGDDFETILEDEVPDYFNAQLDFEDSVWTDAKNRSDDKGPEPEAITTGEHNGVLYAFIGLERQSGFLVYDISDLHEPVFVEFMSSANYGNTEDFGDVAPEDIVFIPAEQGTTDPALILLSNEVSGTVAIYSFGGIINSNEETVATHNSFFEVYPNPATGNRVLITGKHNIIVVDALGNEVLSLKETNDINISGLTPGVYHIITETGHVERFVKL